MKNNTKAKKKSFKAATENRLLKSVLNPFKKKIQSDNSKLKTEAPMATTW